MKKYLEVGNNTIYNDGLLVKDDSIVLVVSIVALEYDGTPRHKILNINKKKVEEVIETLQSWLQQFDTISVTKEKEKQNE